MKFVRYELIKTLFWIYGQFRRHPITRERPFRSFVSFVQWQIGARILRRSVIVPWVDDAKFIIGIGDTGLTVNLYYGLAEFEEMTFLIHALWSSEIFVDIGANIGSFTILASAVVHARSISFEPVPHTVDRLRQQVLINDIQDRVQIENKGVGDKKDQLAFSIRSDTMNKVVLDSDTDDALRVDVVSLDDVLDRNSDYILKIDVEGFECFVLDGAKDLLASGRVLAIIIEINGSVESFGHTNDDVHEKLRTFGFQPVSYNPRTRVLTPISGYNSGSGNTIYVRDIESFAARCRAAPRRTIHTANGIRF